MSNEVGSKAIDLFNKVRARFDNMQIGDENTLLTNDPSKARFFDFDFKIEGEVYGHVTMSLADPSSLKIFYSNELIKAIDDSDEHSRNEWYDWLRSMRRWAKSQLLNFDPRDINKSNLTKKDFQHIMTVDTEDDESDITMHGDNVTEASLTRMGSDRGSLIRSKQTLEHTVVKVKHTNPVDEEKMGARSRQIESIFIENSQGERFKMPINHLSGARAIARHVSNGGNLYDDIGHSIIEMCENTRKIKEFHSYIRRNGLVNEETNDIILSVREGYNHIQNEIRGLRSQRGYTAYAENFEVSEMLDEDVDVTEIKDKFYTDQYESIEGIMPLITRIHEAKKLKEAEEELRDNGARAAEWLDEDKPLILLPDAAQDKLMRSNRPKTNDALLSLVLEDIAMRAGPHLPDELVNFAADMSSHINTGGPYSYGTPVERHKIQEEYKKNRKTAIRLAVKYLKDLDAMQKDPDHIQHVRQVPPGLFRDRSGSIKNEDLEQTFENALTRVFEGTWAWPSTKDQYREIAELINEPLPVGVDAVNATGALYDLLGDDELFDELGELAEREGEDADASPLVMSWLQAADRVIHAAVQTEMNHLEDEEEEDEMMGELPPEDPTMPLDTETPLPADELPPIDDELPPAPGAAPMPAPAPVPAPVAAPVVAPGMEPLPGDIPPEEEEVPFGVNPRHGQSLRQSGHSEDDALLENIISNAGLKKKEMNL